MLNTDAAEVIALALHERAAGFERIALRLHGVATALKSGADAARSRREIDLDCRYEIVELEGAVRELAELAAKPFPDLHQK